MNLLSAVSFASLARRSAFASFQTTRVTFLRDLAESLKNGAELSRALAESAKRCDDRRQALVYANLRDRISEGKRLPEVLGAWFVPAERMLLEAFLEGARTNEEIGQAFDAMVRVIEPRTRVGEENTKLLVMLLAAALSSIGAIAVATYAMTEVQRVIRKDQWPAWLEPMVAVANTLIDGWWLWLALLAAAPLAIRWTLRNWTGPTRRAWDQAAPLFKGYRLTQGSLMMIALGALAGSGRGIGEACMMLSQHASPWLRSYLMSIRARAQQASEADIVDVGLFDWRLMVRVACLCVGGSLPDAIRRVGLESSESVAKETIQGLQRTQSAVAKVFPVVVVVLIGLLATMGGALFMSLRNLR